MALATCAFATPVTRTHTHPTSLAENRIGYMKGFRNPRIDSSVGGQTICISGTVDVTASAVNILINLQGFTNASEVTEFVVEGLQANSTLAKRLSGGQNRVTGTYGIYSQLCFPKGRINAKTVQFLSHGSGIDRNYWNNAPNYSYVDYAAEQGYTTFLYDHLGSGLSDHPDPINIVQASFHVEIAHELVQLLRTGAISDHTFEHVVGIGHSFGSFKTLGVTARHPDDFDAAVLTGFSSNTEGMVAGFASLDLTIASEINLFDFQAYQALTGQIVTVGEYFTTRSLFGVAENFTGPIDVVIGENDFMNCHGDCYYPHNLAAAVKGEFYPAASNGSASYIGPGAGLFLNHHYAALGAYEHIHNFLKTNGF